MAPDHPRHKAHAGARRRRSPAAQAALDLAVAAAAVVIVILSIIAYSGVSPPMVVVESGSMMHANAESMVGVIDTGDLTLVKKVGQDSEITTYMQGARTGYRTYGNFGDVIIYAKNGHREQTPIIHRAITRMALNATNPGCFDFPEIANPDRWCKAGGSVDLGAVWTWDSPAHTGGQEVNLTVDLTRIVQAMAGNLHGGFITKGDHNDKVDQGNLPASPVPGHGGNTVQPVLFEWVVGRSEFELPWFGGIKLAATGNAGAVPANSWRNLLIAVAVIGLGPLGLEMLLRRAPDPWKAKWAATTDKLPGGAKRAARRKEAEEERRREREEHVRGRRKKRHAPSEAAQPPEDLE